MKKMWKIKKDKSAVSPVIATILMVAITVVLAAVLYVMVMGFGGTQTSTPTGSMSIVAGTNSGNISFGQISPVTKYTDCKLTVQDQVAGSAMLISAAFTQPTTTTTSATGMTNIAATGFNPSANGKISVGDTTMLLGSGLASGHTYTVQLLYVPTGGVIASKSFTVA